MTESLCTRRVVDDPSDLDDEQTPASAAADDLRAELAEEAAVDAWRERRET